MSARVLLALLAAGLTGALVLELRDAAPDGATPAVSALALPPPAPALAHEAGTDPVLLARPPFSPDRRPPAPTETEAADVGSEGMPRLTGIMLGPFGRSAMFAVPGAGKPVVAQPGGRVGGLLVERIEADHVVLTAPAGPLTLRPAFTATTPAADVLVAPPLPAMLDVAPRRPAVPPRLP